MNYAMNLFLIFLTAAAPTENLTNCFHFSVSLSRVYKLNHEITSDEPNSNQMNYITLLLGSLGLPQKTCKFDKRLSF